MRIAAVAAVLVGGLIALLIAERLTNVTPSVLAGGVVAVGVVAFVAGRGRSDDR